MADPFRWLEDGTSDAVHAWTDAQDEKTRGHLDGPLRDEVAARLRPLFGIGLVTPPVPRRGRYFHQRRTGDQPQPILYVRDGLDGRDRALIDPAALGDDTAALDWWFPSDDGRLLAFGVSVGGSEQSTLHVMEVDGGARLDEIPHTRACSLAWEPDGAAFYYTRYPAPGTVPDGDENYHRSVFHHALGTDWRADARVFGERPREDWPNVELSPDGRLLVVTVARGWTRTDVYVRDLAGPDGFRTAIEGEEVQTQVLVRNDRLLMRTNRGAARYRLMAAEPAEPQADRWREVIPESPQVLESADAIGSSLVLGWLAEASSRVTIHSTDGSAGRPLDLPTLGTAAVTGEHDGAEAFFSFSSFAHPPAVYRLDLRTMEVTEWARTESALDASGYRVRFVRFPSTGGATPSMFLVDRPSRARGGPAVLTGYGGFDVSLTPAFARSVLPFLDAGGLYAVAHLRGGGEYGEDWHRAGMLEKKQNAFDDFIAAAEWLIAEGETTPRQLAILGGSNGGLLVGAALTQRPELFRAVVCQVPLLDMVRYHLFRIAKLWIREYGSPDDPRAFAWLLAYSPYHRVQDGTPYPAVLLTTGEEDSRVDPMHARKMAARLQEASSSGRPVLLRVESRAGHGQGKPIARLLDEWTDVWTFLWRELSVPITAVEA